MSMKGSIRIYSEEHGWLVYLVLFVYVFIFYLIFSWLDLFQTNPDSARYMLSALVQSEAAIVAIVITLSLVAVQLTASSYSPRVTEIFRKAPDLWILMISYIAAIIYGLGILKLIEATPEVNLECCIRIAYFSGIFCFIALLPYTYNMFEMLKPSTVIKKLSKKITKENLLKAEKNPEADPIQPIIDIIRGSMMKYDYETAKNGLETVSYKISKIFWIEEFTIDEQRIISEIIYGHFDRLGKLLVNKADEYLIMELIKYIHETVNLAVEKKLHWFVEKAALSIAFISGYSVEKRLERMIIYADNHLASLGRITIEKELIETTRWIVMYLGEPGKICLREGLVNPVFFILQHLSDIGSIAASNDNAERVTKLASDFIDEIRKIADGKGLRDLVLVAEQSLEKINEAKKKFPPQPL